MPTLRLDKVETTGLRVDLRRCIVTVGPRELQLPPLEFALIAHLAGRPGEPVASEELLHAVWPDAKGHTIGDVHRHMYRLRRLLGEDGSPAIRNRRGFGYVLEI